MVSGPGHLPTPDHEAAHQGYRQAIDWLFALSPGVRPAEQIVADKPRKVARTRWLLARLGHPEREFSSVLVAGTKGKGSTAAMLESIARAAGHKTGIYSQPHLHTWRERTRFDGRLIRPSEVARLMQIVRAAVDELETVEPGLGRPTTFEVGTAFTCLAFARHGARLAIMEVGVGGIHDATNALEPLFVILGPISYDHVSTLGSTLSSIASEKAGLFQQHGTALVGRQPSEARATIERIAAERSTRLESLGIEWHWRPDDEHAARGPFSIAGPSFQLADLRIPLLGRHQRDNATLAVAGAATLTKLGFAIPTSAVRAGLEAVHWPGRAQIVGRQPTTVVDGAHNADSAARLAETLVECFKETERHLVVGMSEGKDVEGMLEHLVPLARSITVTRASHTRSMPLDRIAWSARALGAEVMVEPDVCKAVARATARAAPKGLVCVTGSLFLVAEATRAVAFRVYSGAPLAAGVCV